MQIKPRTNGYIKVITVICLVVLVVFLFILDLLVLFVSRFFLSFFPMEYMDGMNNNHLLKEFGLLEI